jgi:hypothetical protein
MLETRNKMVRVTQAIWVNTLKRVRKRKYKEVGLKQGKINKTLNKREQRRSFSGSITNIRKETLNNS